MVTHKTGDPGLCRTCQHVKRSETRRGSVFWLCTLALVDTAFQKYPPLPVVRCHGYQLQHDATLQPTVEPR